MALKAITQPAGGSVLDAVSWILDRCEVYRVDIAAAYITGGGAKALISTLQAGVGDAWPQVEKRWLTSFDYFRTEPVALETVRDLAGSTLKIHNSAVVSRKGCVPAVPFHPKSFIFFGNNAEFVLSGSGNVSKSGLGKGHEAGIVVGTKRPTPASSAQAAECIASFTAWFDCLWVPASTLTPQLLRRYSDSYESEPNLRHPTPTDDDLMPEAKPRQLSADDLRKLRACRNLWIEAGNITLNRGKQLPGNQLMMKRLSRVFFGFDPVDVPKDTLIGYLEVKYAQHDPHPCSLTFSNNLMDKLTLPIPGADGPPAYDNKNLLFRRVKPGLFELSLGTTQQKAQWRRRSKSIGAAFRMSNSGRAWGVF